MIHDGIVQAILKVYDTLRYKPPPRQYTVLAAFYLVSGSCLKIISVATGTKCLPANKLPIEEALHDSHAEVLARRGAVRWLLEEITRRSTSGLDFESEWLQRLDKSSYALRDGVSLGFYVSTVPCGDASMGLLASTQDAEMAALKDSNSDKNNNADSALPTLARGRDNYALLGVLRTKPARADAPCTASMSCSDKIASWAFLGIQGALGARFFAGAPVYVDQVLVGLDLPVGEGTLTEVRRIVKEDCTRALVRRIAGVGECGPYSLHPPTIHFTEVPFVHSRSMIPHVAGSCNESLYWVADSSTRRAEVLINGFKRGVPPSQRMHDQSLPNACRKSMFKLYHDTLRLCALPPEPPDASFCEVKRSIEEYRRAKEHLIGATGVFSGWNRGSTTSFNASKNLQMV